MTKALLPVVLLLFAVVSFSQNAPSIQWQKSLGGTQDDEAFAIQQTPDGGFIIAGESYSNDNDVSGNHGTSTSDYWIVKTDAAGAIEWQKCLGGSSYDVSSSVDQTTDGGYVVAGFARSNDGDITGHHGTTSYYDYWVVKLESDGSIEWEKSLGGSFNEFANAVEQTTDEGYVVGGYSYSSDGDVTGHHGGSGTADYWVVKLDSAGNIDWQKSLGGDLMDNANSLQQTADGGYVVSGSSNSINGDVTGNHGTFDVWTVKLDSEGNIDWQKCYGGDNEEGASFIQQCTDQGFIMGGWSNSNNEDVSGNHGNYDYWILKTNSSGDIEWQKSLGGSGVDWCYGGSQTSNGGFVVGGYSESVNGDVTGNHGGDFWGDYWISQLDASGNLTWQKCLGGSGDDVATAVQEISNGEYIVLGWSQSNDGDVTSNYGVADVWVVNLSFPTAIEQNGDAQFSFSVFPNPATHEFVVDVQFASAKTFNSLVTISDMLGRNVYEKVCTGVNGRIHEVISVEFPAGVYMVNIHSDCLSHSVPIVIGEW